MMSGPTSPGFRRQAVGFSASPTDPRGARSVGLLPSLSLSSPPSSSTVLTRKAMSLARLSVGITTDPQELPGAALPRGGGGESEEVTHQRRLRRLREERARLQLQEQEQEERMGGLATTAAAAGAHPSPFLPLGGGADRRRAPAPAPGLSSPPSASPTLARQTSFAPSAMLERPVTLRELRAARSVTAGLVGGGGPSLSSESDSGDLLSPLLLAGRLLPDASTLAEQKVKLGKETQEDDLDRWLSARGCKPEWHFSRHQKRQLREFFRLLDADGSGEVNIAELEGPLLSTGLVHNRASLEELVRRIDKDRSGEIDFFEFLAAFKPSGASKAGRLSRDEADSMHLLKRGGAGGSPGKEDIPSSARESSAIFNDLLAMLQGTAVESRGAAAAAAGTGGGGAAAPRAPLSPEEALEKLRRPPPAHIQRSYSFRGGAGGGGQNGGGGAGAAAVLGRSPSSLLRQGGPNHHLHHLQHLAPLDHPLVSPLSSPGGGPADAFSTRGSPARYPAHIPPLALGSLAEVGEGPAAAGEEGGGGGGGEDDDDDALETSRTPAGHLDGDRLDAAALVHATTGVPPPPSPLSAELPPMPRDEGGEEFGGASFSSTASAEEGGEEEVEGGGGGGGAESSSGEASGATAQHDGRSEGAVSSRRGGPSVGGAASSSYAVRSSLLPSPADPTLSPQDKLLTQLALGRGGGRLARKGTKAGGSSVELLLRDVQTVGGSRSAAAAAALEASPSAPRSSAASALAAGSGALSIPVRLDAHRRSFLFTLLTQQSAAHVKTKDRLQAALVAAGKRRDAVEVAAVREALKVEVEAHERRVQRMNALTSVIAREREALDGKGRARAEREEERDLGGGGGGLGGEDGGGGLLLREELDELDELLGEDVDAHVQ
jgi:hypothetical protein